MDGGGIDDLFLKTFCNWTSAFDLNIFNFHVFLDFFSSSS